MARHNPEAPEFASWKSFDEFAHQVRCSRRYVWNAAIKAFLDTVLATLKNRDVNIAARTILYRAQRGIDYDYNQALAEDEDGIGKPVGYCAARMKPLPNRARQGRANPAGIPVLYLASTAQTAISEVRPWVGSEVSIAQFEIVRNIRAVNLSLGHGQVPFGHLTFDQLEGIEPLNAATKEKAVWIDIDNTFSQPVTLSDDEADYVPTQILAELFKNAGYDAIIYRSQVGKEGYNYALFDLDDANAIVVPPVRSRV